MAGSLADRRPGRRRHPPPRRPAGRPEAAPTRTTCGGPTPWPTSTSGPATCPGPATSSSGSAPPIPTSPTSATGSAACAEARPSPAALSHPRYGGSGGDGRRLPPHDRAVAPRAPAEWGRSPCPRHRPSVSRPAHRHQPGRAPRGAQPRPGARELPSGDSLVAYDVTVRPEASAGEAATAESVPVAWFDPPAAATAMAAGDDVVVVGRVRRRFFRAGGATASRTEVVADPGGAGPGPGEGAGGRSRPGLGALEGPRLGLPAPTGGAVRLLTGAAGRGRRRRRRPKGSGAGAHLRDRGVA